MPRLRVVEPPQHGVRTGSKQNAPKRPRKRYSPSQRERDASATPRTDAEVQKKRKPLTKDEKITLLVKYMDLHPDKSGLSQREYSRRLRALCGEFSVHKGYPSVLKARVLKTEVL